jgi:hypothetical protein
MNAARDQSQQFLATVSYRAAKVLRDAPVHFASRGPDDRPPSRILAHLGDLLDWALSQAAGHEQWHNATLCGRRK